ncbi:hypothetical protein T06_13759 [Trichinella sp. T6]|nr:hypothetical protein T06_13759 [Trichinella sp. T6]
MSCKSYGVTAIDVHEVARLTIYACETIHICVAAHAIWCGSYVFGGSEWPSGPSRVDRMDPPMVISAKIVRPVRGLGGDDAVGVPGAGGAESLGFPRSREEERALCLPKEQGRVCTLPCLRE